MKAMIQRPRTGYRRKQIDLNGAWISILQVTWWDKAWCWDASCTPASNGALSIGCFARNVDAFSSLPRSSFLRNFWNKYLSKGRFFVIEFVENVPRLWETWVSVSFVSWTKLPLQIVFEDFLTYGHVFCDADSDGVDPWFWGVLKHSAIVRALWSPFCSCPQYYLHIFCENWWI